MTITTPLQVLEAARATITPPGAWTQKASARNAKGNSVTPTNKNAVCFCLLGAIDRIQAESELRCSATTLLRDLVPPGFGRMLADYNDASTHAEVLSLFDKAIATLKKE